MDLETDFTNSRYGEDQNQFAADRAISLYWRRDLDHYTDHIGQNYPVQKAEIMHSHGRGKLKTPTAHDKRPAAHSENLNFVTKSVKFKSLTVDIDGKPALCTNLQFKHNGASAQECDRPMDTRQTNITLAHVNDAYSIATMSRDIIEHGLQWNWTPERIGRCILSPDINVVTAKDCSTVVGLGVMYYGYSKAHLNLLGVDASWRSLGIGNRLLMWLEQCAITAGIEHCQLEVRQSNDFARKFYSNHGYAEIEVVPGYYQRKEDAIRMSRCLQQPHLLK